MNKRIIEIKNINKSNQERIYNKLLDGTLKLKVKVNYSDDYHLADIDTCNNDFCLSSWTYNYYVRPPKAVRFKKYETLSRAWQALNKTVKAKTKLSLNKELRVLDNKGNFLFILKMN